MNWSIPAAVLALLCCTVAVAAEPQAPSEYGNLYKVWKAEVQGLKEVLPPLSPREIAARKRETNARFTPQFLKLAREQHQLQQDRLWVNCLIWMTVEGVPGKEFDAMFDLMAEESTKSPEHWHQLMLLMSELIPLSSERIDPALARIVESHTEPLLQSSALYALAARTKRRAEFAGDAAGCEEAERLLERLLADYPDASTYRGKNHENAQILLDELRSPVAISKPAPPISGESLDGNSFQLADHRGRVVVVAFSGHWCPPCVAMHPVLKQLVEQYGERLTIVELNSDPAKNLARVRDKVKTDRLNWILIPEGSEGPQAEAWNVTVWPTFYVLDQQHRIRFRGTGNLGGELGQRIERCLAEEPQP